MLSQSSRCEVLKCQVDLEENYTSKWQQVVFPSHTHFKREDHKKEYILPANMIMDNQAGGENIMLQVKTFERVFKNVFSIAVRSFQFCVCGGVHKHILNHFQHDSFSQIEKNLCREGSTCIYKQRKWSW